MAINDFVRRSIQIVGGGIAQSTTDYFDNAISFVNDVKEVIDMGKQMGSDGAKKFNELKSSGILKKTRDWFYNEGGMFGDFDFDDEEFDAGFEIESADSENNAESSKPLSKDMMTDIAKKQTGAMYKAFGRQADLQIANTAEIISTINTRTAELTASVNNVNNTLIQIGKRLDLIVEWTSARTKKEEEEKRQAGILDYGGGISLTGVVNKAKENAEDSMLGTFLNIGKTMLGSGMMTPEMVMSFILSQTILDKKWDKLGKKSINDIGEFINDTVDEVVQNTLTKVLTTKNEMLSSLFEDIISKAGGKNYQNSVVNQYNDKPAVFDGMTRKSIVTVIPGYLNEILKAVSKDGMGREIDKKGNLTKKKTDSFVNEVADSYFRSGSMEWDQRKKASERTSLDTQTISDAVRTLTGCWTWEFYKSGNIVLRLGEVKDLNYESTARVVKNAAYLMSTKTKYSEDQWMDFYMGILEEIDEFKYRQELQKIADRADKNLEEFAKKHVNNHQARQVDQSVLIAAFEKNWGDFSHNEEAAPSPTSGSNSTQATPAKPTQIGSIGNIGITDLDYMAGIFDRLNRGLNVFITGQNLNNRDHQYKKIRMIPGYAARKARSGSDTGSDDPDGGGGVKNVAKDVVNKIQTATSNSEKTKANMDEATREAYEAEERGEELSDEQKKLIKTYKKENSFGGKIKRKISNFVHKSQREGIVSDPEIYAGVSDVMDNIKTWWNDIKPEKLKKGEEFIKNTEAYQTVANSRQLESVKKAGADVRNKAANVAWGKEQLNDDGSISRSGGIIQKGVRGFSKLVGGTANKIDNAKIAASNKLATTKTLEKRTEELLKDYGPDKTFDESNTDALQMQLISSEINAAMSNGDYSNIDDQTILKAIAKIKDKDIQRQLKQSVIPLLKRNGKVVEETKEEPKGKGVFSKVATLVKGGIKMILAPIVGYIKLVIGSVFMIIKKGVGLIINFAKKRIKHGLVSMKAGAKSLGKGVARMFKPMTALAKKAVDITFSVANKINSIVKKATPYLKAFGKKLLSVGKVIAKPFVATAKFVGNSFKHVFGEIFLGKKYDKDGNEVKPEGGSDEKKKGLIGKAKEKLSGLGDKFAKTSFGQGFMKATKERKEAQAKAKLKEEAAPIKEGIETSEVGKDLQAALEAEDGKKGFFKKLITLVQGIFDKTPDPNDPTPEEGDGGSGGDTGTSGSETTGGTVEGAENGETTGGEETPTPTPTPDTGGGDAGGAEGGKKKGIFSKIGGAIKGGASDILGGIGEALGGLTGMMGGLLEIVLSIVMSLEGFKALTNLVMEILKSSLEPLNEAFQAITKALKPILKQLGGIIKQLAEFIVVIVDAVVDVIKPIISDVVQPVLEVVAPLLQSIIGCLTPLLKIVGILLKVIMAPLMGLFKFVLLPILKIIGDAVQIIMGVLQIGFGLIMICLGGIIGAIGKVISCIPGAGGKGKDLAKSGGDMLDQGKDFVAQGLKSVAQGVVNIILDYASLYSLGASDALLDRGEKEDKKETKKIEAPEDSSAVQNTYANGDVNNYYGSSDIYNTYGGEYQRGMGGYLNMDQRGCGPIALADMYNRNQSGRVSARSLAGSMFNNGTYDPRRGTSVGGYIDSARSLGMNLTPGKVTQQSLKSASPTHPITVVGSGSDYGTRNGNNHFMNVIGTDRHGGAYVSNPLTGRIDRRPASTVAGSAVMGLYGSGDEADGGYSFPDAIKNAFQKLKDEAAKILGLFNMEKSEEEKTEEIIGAEQKKAAAEQAKKDLGDKYAQYEEKAKAVALEDFKKKYPKKDSESDDDYQAMFDKWWEGDADQAKYLAEAGVLDNALEAAKKNNSTVWNELKEGTDNFQKNMLSSLESIKKSNNEGHSGGGGAGTVSASASGAVMDSFGIPKYTDLNMTDFIDSSSNKSGHSLVHSYFGAKNSDTAWSYDGNYYIQRNHPNSEGEGSSGTPDHHGIDINFDKGSEGTPLYAITGGKVVSSQGGGLVETPSSNGGCGNNVQWKDSGGYYHWYMHMRDDPLVNVGDDIEPGQLLGYVGDTGWSSGAHLHYSVNKAPGSSGNQAVNPLLYWDTFEPSGDLVGDTDEEKIWAYLVNNGFEKHAAAGVMGAFEVESSNDPNTLEGYYAFDDRTRNNAVVREAMQNYDTMDDYVVNKLFPYYNKSGTGYKPDGYKGADGHYYPGIGLAQWTGDRTVALSDYTVKKGLGWNNLSGQLDYLKHELDNVSSYKNAVTEMNNSNDVNKSTEIWLDKFEGNPGSALAERQKYANDFYNRFQNWTPMTKKTFSPTGKGSVSTGFGMVSSADDARRVDNYNQIKSASGKNTGVVFTDSDNLMLRQGMGTDTSVLIEIPKGTKLNLEASGNNAWYKTTFGGKTGYVSSAFILLDNDDANDFDYSGGQQQTEDIDDSMTMQDHLLAYAKESTGGNKQTEQPKQTKQTPKAVTPSWYDFASWFSEDSREKRTDFYKTAAENHNKAMQQKTKGGGVAFGKDKLNIDAYLNKYGTAQVSRGASKKYAGDEQYYQYQYANAKDKTKGGDLIDYTTFPVYQQLQELGKIYGAGDVDSMLAEDAFWNNYLGWNSKYNSNVSIPMSDGSDTAYSSDTYYDTETGTTVVNNYAVTRAEDKATDARLKAVLANTYNVRSETMEALLNAILEELKKRKDPRGGGNNTNGSTKLFDERIPSQVTRLSVG